jgi:hypothetical protein
MHSERCSRSIRFLRMETAAQYRLFAEACERLATQSSNERHREILKEMAKEWRKLAEAVQNKT